MAKLQATTDRLDGIRTDRTNPRQSVGAAHRARYGILPDAIVDSYDLGETIEELREGFPSLSVAQIKRLIEVAHTLRGQPHP